MQEGRCLQSNGCAVAGEADGGVISWLFNANLLVGRGHLPFGGGDIGPALQQGGRNPYGHGRRHDLDGTIGNGSTTGISAIIAPDGKLLASTRTWTRAEIEARVPLRSSITLADRLGGWPEAVLAWGTVAAVAWVICSELRRRRERTAPGRTARRAGRTAQ